LTKDGLGTDKAKGTADVTHRFVSRESVVKRAAWRKKKGAIL